MIIKLTKNDSICAPVSINIIIMTYQEHVDAINRSYKAIKYIDPQTPKYDKLAVSRDGTMIRYIPNP